MTGKEPLVVRAVIFYRDYINGPLWAKRKEEYYSRHAKACYICGATKNVQLNHIKYGNYGQEADRDFVALCGDHHEALHALIGVRKNMHYQTEHFLEKMIAEWDAEHEQKPVSTIQKPQPKPSAAAKVIDQLARPIWHLVFLIVRRK